MSASGHSRPMHSAPVPTNVRCYSNSDQIADMPRVTLSATFYMVRRDSSASIVSSLLASKNLHRRLHSHLTIDLGRKRPADTEPESVEPSSSGELKAAGRSE